MDTRTHRRPGPEPKGVRRQFTVRVPVEQFEIYEQAAASGGSSIGDYLVSALARQHDLPEPTYVRRRHGGGDDQLPLPATG